MKPMIICIASRDTASGPEWRAWFKGESLVMTSSASHDDAIGMLVRENRERFPNTPSWFYGNERPTAEVGNLVIDMQKELPLTITFVPWNDSHMAVKPTSR